MLRALTWRRGLLLPFALVAFLLCVLPPHHSQADATAPVLTSESCANHPGAPHDAPPGGANTTATPEQSGHHAPDNILVCHNDDAMTRERVSAPAPAVEMTWLAAVAVLTLPRLAGSLPSPVRDASSRRSRSRFTGFALLISIGVSRT